MTAQENHQADDDQEEDVVVQLGFSVQFEDNDHRRLAGHNLPLWKDWDGGQLGGRPTWLNPEHIPQNYLTCKCCQKPMIFICQLYCPCDEINSNAFHRTFYVFACPMSNNDDVCGKEPTGAIRVLRTQLPKKNSYFPIEQDESSKTHLPEHWEVNTCRVCGQRGHGKCPVQGYHFCGRHHQKEHMKHVFKKDNKSSSSQLDFPFMPSVLTSSELVVEEEPFYEKSSLEDRERLTTTIFQEQCDNDDNSDDEVLDSNLEQEDLNKMTGAGPETVTKDAVTMQFYDRINRIKNVNTQCLRYLRWPDHDRSRDTASPLWIRSDYRPNGTDIPPCKRCGAERRFEFQLMPQMLHYLLEKHNEGVRSKKVDNDKNNGIKKEEIEAVRVATNIIEQSPPEEVPPDLAATTEKAIDVMKTKIMACNSNIDWGCVSVYTCTACCGIGDGVVDETEEKSSKLGAYIEEFAWKQPSLDYSTPDS